MLQILQTLSCCMYNVSDTSCGSATLRGPMTEDGVVEPVLRVNASLYSEDPIVIRCQLNRTEDPNVHYNLRLKIDFTSLDEIQYHKLIPGDPIFKSAFIPPEPLGNITYYDVFINASERLERSIISCGADYQPTHGMPHQHCYTKSVAVIIFRDYDPCDHPTATPAATPTIPPTNSSTSKLVTTKRATAPPVTTPITPPTTSSTDEILTTKWAMSIPTPNKTLATQTGANVSDTHITMNKREFFLVVGIAILVGITLVVANGVQLWVIIIMRNRRANPKVQISATKDAALERDTEMDCGLESEEGTTIQNNVATDSG